MEKQIKELTETVERLCEAVEQLDSTIERVFRPTEGIVDHTLTDCIFNLTYELKQLKTKEGE
jgi:archaellum component FlaC